MDGTDNREEVYVFGPFRLNPFRRQLDRGGTALTLTPKVFDVLLYLVERPGEVVTKDALLDAVWQGRVVEETNVKQAIFTLRRTLGDDGGRMILTAPGRGYRFVADVRRLAPVAISSPVLGLAPDPATPVVRTRPRRLRFGALGLGALLLLIAAGGVVWWQTSRTPSGKTVALADFDNRTGEAVFDRSLDNLLRVDLSQSPFLNVITEKQNHATLALMTRPADTSIKGAVAAEVCTRNNGDAVIQGALASFGGRYLLTLSANDCATGDLVAATKAEVTGRDAVIPAMDRLIDRLRARLGESGRSLRTFDAPLLPEKTASLEALKVYSDGKWQFDHGRMLDAIPLVRHAIDLDSQFPAAYTLLAVCYLSLNDFANGQAALEKAHALLPLMSERGRLQIAALTAQFVTHDYAAAIRATRLQTAIYPRESVAWANLANAEDFIGEHAQAVADGKRALALQPQLESPYVVLTRAQLSNGQLADADATARLAIARGFADDSIHRERLRIALVSGDAAGVQREEAWARSAQNPIRVWEAEAEAALAQGRVREAKGIFAHIGQISAERGMDDPFRPSEDRLLATLGYGLAALPPMKAPTGVGESRRDYLWTLARVGDGTQAERMLAGDLLAGPKDTLLNAVYAPEVRASMALRRGDAAAAIRDIAPALPYASRDLDVYDLLGNAYLAAHEGPRAAAAFRMNLTHRYWGAGDMFYALAKLGLAKALKLEGDKYGAVREYQAFLSDWRGADPDVPALANAKSEYHLLNRNPA